ncbi:phosphonopyruvate decarboxylase (plasmid) [Agrobacterium sp. rho-8.1]|nr:phosphonopyruvate decarboxylase [Agrobacterium sp. rho-8.1]
MLDADTFLTSLKKRNMDFLTGVPCSFLTPLINAANTDKKIDYVGATSEGEAVAIAAGAWLAGRQTVVLCQNSGLGNMVNPLTSLNWPFQIPTLLIVTWRGRVSDNDEPQHQLMGEVTQDLLRLIRIPHAPFPKSALEIDIKLDDAASYFEKGRPYAMIVEKGGLCGSSLGKPQHLVWPPANVTNLRSYKSWPSRTDAILQMVEAIPDTAAWVATTGYCGRELHAICDRPQHLYQVGSMGGASAMGLGIALNVYNTVVVLDGDGAALMKLGNIATIGATSPKNLIHIVLDNEEYTSTGGQPSVSPFVNFGEIAVSCGYASAFTLDSLKGLEQALAHTLVTDGPHLLHLKISADTPEGLPRPSIAPHEVAQRFRDFLTVHRRKQVRAGL